MDKFTGLQYLMIDIANHAPLGLGKQTYQTRISWVEEQVSKGNKRGDMLKDLYEIAKDSEWKDKPLFVKALLALEDFCEDRESGHLVGFDASSSGVQLMSAMTGCESGCRATGLIDQDRRANFYAEVGERQSEILGYPLKTAEKEAKSAGMTVFYGSTAEPKKVYGKGTPELSAFYEAIHQIAPKAMWMLGGLLSSWQPFAKQHSWTMPDGTNVQVKNMVSTTANVKIDELNGTGFKYCWYENEGEERGKKNAANVVHATDAYLLRSLVRRCGYNLEEVINAYKHLSQEHTKRYKENRPDASVGKGFFKFDHYLKQYERSLVIDTCILKYINRSTVSLLEKDHIIGLMTACVDMLSHNPFEIVTVHDDFKCHPNNMNYLRHHYNSIMAAICDSDLCTDLLHQVSKVEKPEGGQDRRYTELSNQIKEANYGIN